MKKMFFLFSIILFFSCTNNLDEDIEKAIDSSSKLTNMAINKDLINLKMEFDSVYNYAINNSDFKRKTDLINFYNILKTNIKYLDSIKKDLEKYDSKDISNNKIIKENFLYGTVSDSIYKRLEVSFLLSQDVATNSIKKDSVIKISKNILFDSNISEWKRVLFSIDSPGGTAMLIYGFEAELYKAGITSIK